MPVREIEHLLAPEPQAARVARGVVGTSPTAWGLSAWHSDAAVIVGELVTNGVMHARTARCWVLQR